MCYDFHNNFLRKIIAVSIVVCKAIFHQKLPNFINYC